MKALLGFLFRLLVYMLINFMIETVLYRTETSELISKLTDQEITLRNVVLSIGDLKIILTVMTIVLWYRVWLKIKHHTP